MANEKLLNALLSRISARETASIALITIASSASLVLLAFTDKILEFWWIPVVGILFPLISLAYNEVTRLTIHEHDQNLVRKIIKDDKDTTLDSEKILPYKKQRILRMALSRTILLIPVMAWVIITPLKFAGEYAISLIIMGIILIGTAIVLLLMKSEIKKLNE